VHDWLQHSLLEKQDVPVAPQFVEIEEHPAMEVTEVLPEPVQTMLMSLSGKQLPPPYP
jgi:hypothetical protein